MINKNLLKNASHFTYTKRYCYYCITIYYKGEKIKNPRWENNYSNSDNCYNFGSKYVYPSQIIEYNYKLRMISTPSLWTTGKYECIPEPEFREDINYCKKYFANLDKEVEKEIELLKLRKEVLELEIENKKLKG